jgi:hypothetical protein
MQLVLRDVDLIVSANFCNVNNESVNERKRNEFLDNLHVVNTPKWFWLWRYCKADCHVLWVLGYYHSFVCNVFDIFAHGHRRFALNCLTVIRVDSFSTVLQFTAL